MKWINNLKMIQKLLSAFLIVSLFIGIVGVVGIINMKNINSNTDNIYSIDLVGVKSLLSIKVNLAQIRADMLVTIDPTHRAEKQAKEDEMIILRAELDQYVQEYLPTITTELDRTQFAEFEKLLADNRTSRTEIIKQVDAGNYVKPKP